MDNVQYSVIVCIKERKLFLPHPNATNKLLYLAKKSKLQVVHDFESETRLFSFLGKHTLILF